MRALLVSAALTALIAPLSAGAQSLPLTESEALTRLSTDSPRVRAIRAAVDVARTDVLAAARWPNPRVTFSHESVAGVTEQIAMVGQTLPITGRRGLEMEAASALVAASSNRANDELRRARADLRLAFARLAAAQTRERELSGAVARLRQLAEVLMKREAAGDASGFDRLRADREVLDVDADRAIAAIARARAQAALAGFFTDVRDPSTLLAVDAGRPPAVVPPLEALVEQAEPVRGELLAMRNEIDSAQFSERAAARRLVPEPEIVVGSKSSTFGGRQTGGVVGVQATIPLFDRAGPERALAAARISRAQARLETFRLALRSEIAAWRSTVIERRQLAERYRGVALDGSAEVERIAQVSYDAGERGILELLDAYRTGSSARVRQATLDAEVREAEIELEFVSGWEIP